MKYFAYGSNMALARLRARARSAAMIGVCHLAGHHLRFHKVGQDGSAKCDAYETGHPGHVVEGVVYELDASEVGRLDLAEGLGNGYKSVDVDLLDARGGRLAAFTYIATRIDPSLRPFSWYRRHVLIGAREAGLSPAYIDRIEQVVAIDDHDRDRSLREMSVYERPSAGVAL